MLLKHHIRRHPELRPVASAQLENRRNQKYLEKMGASSMENVLLCQSLILQDLIDAVIPYEKIKPVEPLPTPPTDTEVSQLFFLKYISQIKNKNSRLLIQKKSTGSTHHLYHQK